MRDKNLRSKGHNALPWSFDLESGRILTLNDPHEKICYAELALLASRALMSESVQPEMRIADPIEAISHAPSPLLSLAR